MDNILSELSSILSRLEHKVNIKNINTTARSGIYITQDDYSSVPINSIEEFIDMYNENPNIQCTVNHYLWANVYDTYIEKIDKFKLCNMSFVGNISMQLPMLVITDLDIEKEKIINDKFFNGTPIAIVSGKKLQSYPFYENATQLTASTNSINGGYFFIEYSDYNAQLAKLANMESLRYVVNSRLVSVLALSLAIDFKNAHSYQ